MKSIKIFTPKYIIFLIIPLLIEQLLTLTIGMADTIMVASCGESSVSGIALVDSISTLLINLFSSFATGGAVIASQYIGAKKNEKACIAAKNLIIITILVSASILIVGLIGNKNILRLIFGNITSEVLAAAEAYFILILCSYPFLALINSCNALFRAMGKSTITMVVSLLINLINISGNAIFIFIFGMGTRGAGLASLISRIVGAAILLIVLCNKKHPVHINSPLKLEWNSHIARKITSIAIPAGIEGSIFQLGKVLVQSMITTFGTASIAANAAVNNINSFANMPGAVIGLASVTIIGQCCGAQNYKAALYYAKRLLTAAYGIMFLTCILFFALTKPLVSLYNLSAEGTAIAIEVNYHCLIWSIAIWPLAFTMPNFIRATGDAKFPMVVSISSMWIFRIFFSYFLGVKFGYGLLGVTYGMFMDWICRASFFTHHFFKGKWMHKEALAE